MVLTKFDKYYYEYLIKNPNEFNRIHKERRDEWNKSMREFADRLKRTVEKNKKLIY